MSSVTSSFILLAGLGVSACGAHDPRESDGNHNNEPPVGLPCDPPVTHAEDTSACAPLPTDYMPRDNSSAADSWPACISDDNAYHQIQPSVSTIARVAAFEVIGDLLWKNNKVPSAGTSLMLASPMKKNRA